MEKRNLPVKSPPLDASAGVELFLASSISSAKVRRWTTDSLIVCWASLNSSARLPTWFIKSRYSSRIIYIRSLFFLSLTQITFGAFQLIENGEQPWRENSMFSLQRFFDLSLLRKVTGFVDVIDSKNKKCSFNLLNFPFDGSKRFCKILEISCTLLVNEGSLKVPNGNRGNSAGKGTPG